MGSLISVQSLSLILLLAGIGLAFSQIRLSGWILGWILLSGALLLQGFRSMLSYVADHGGVDATTYTVANDWMGLGFSLLVVAAMHSMREVFARHRMAAETLRTFSAGASDAIIIMDNTGTIAIWNQAAQRIFGYDAQEAQGKKIGELIVPERYRSEFQSMFDSFGDSSDGAVSTPPADLAGLRKDGTEIVTEYSMSRAVIDGTWHTMYIVRDISVRRQAEHALRAQEERFRVLFDRASDGILIVTPDGQFVAANDSFARMHGYTTEEIRGLSLKDLDTPETFCLVHERMQRIQSGESITFEVEHYHKDGHVVPLEVSSSLIFSDGGPLIQAFHRDITERNRQRNAITEHNALLTRQKNELQATLGRVKRLEGMISICAYCKKIRTESNAWQQLEQYIGEHSDAVFSHALCPQCFDKQSKLLG